MIKKLKAVSPVIATILIVVIAIALVSILLSWGQNFIQTNTAKADSTIDTSCNGADITIRSCDYNSVAEELSLILVNSGDIRFNEDNDFSLILIDGDDDFDNNSTDILSSEAFEVGESEKVTISSYEATSPIKVEIRSTQCTGFFRSKTCR